MKPDSDTGKDGDIDIGTFVRGLMMCQDSVPIFGAASGTLGSAILPLFCPDADKANVDHYARNQLKPSCKEYTLRY